MWHPHIGYEYVPTRLAHIGTTGWSLALHKRAGEEKSYTRPPWPGDRLEHRVSCPGSARAVLRESTVDPRGTGRDADRGSRRRRHRPGRDPGDHPLRRDGRLSPPTAWSARIRRGQQIVQAQHARPLSWSRADDCDIAVCGRYPSGGAAGTIHPQHAGGAPANGWSLSQAAITDLRGRPGRRLAPATTPFSSSSPPQTPQGSPR